MEEQVVKESSLHEIVETDYTLLCRICGNVNDELLPLFEGECLEDELASKIQLHFPIKITEDDIYPLKICVNCANSVLQFHVLYQSCIEADDKFKSMLSEEELEEDSYPITNNNLNSSDEELDFEIEILEEKLLLEGEDNSIVHTYGDCIQADISQDDIRMRDEVQELEKIELNDCQLSENVDKQTTSCASILRISTEPSDDTPELSMNLTVNLGDTIEDMKLQKKCLDDNFELSKKCPECKKDFFNKEEFCIHLINDHENSDTLLVKACQNDVKLDVPIKEDALIEINGKSMYKCEVCEKVLSSPHIYKNHLLIHSGGKPYDCFLCGKAFRIYQGVLRHIQSTHLKIKRYSCEICDKKFVNLDNLKGHYRLHSGDRSFVCHICGKSFRQRASLLLHNRIHQDTYLYHCPYCSKGFRAKTPMILHIGTHTGERSFKCDICNRYFRLKNDLKMHKTTHSQEKPFECVECGLPFKQKRYLTRHYKRHHAQTTLKSS